MGQELNDEQIRIELKRIVEDFQATTLTKLNDVVTEAEEMESATELQVRNLRDKIEASKVHLSDSIQQIMDFIDRQ